MRPALLLLLACLSCAIARADNITYLGEDTTTHGAWRTPSVIKAFDPNGDNIYGTSGYDLLDANGHDILQNPTGVTVTRLVSEYPGNPSYTTIDNPTGDGVAGSSILSGVWYAGTAGGVDSAYASISFAVAGDFVIGIYTDNQDRATISPSSLRIYQTVGGSATSGYVTNAINRTGDWFFFDVNASAGSVFKVSGIDDDGDTNGIGAISFDAEGASGVPEPATISLFSSALVGLFLRHRKK